MTSILNPLRLLLAGALMLSLTNVAAAEPVAINPTGPASGEYAAVSVLGDAHCSMTTCVAISPGGNAVAGCADPECSDIPTCDDFVCMTFAASVLGDARALGWCQTFLVTCVFVSVDTAPSVIACYTDVNDYTICRVVA